MTIFLLPSARARKGFVVYKIFNLLNGKFYIGKCSRIVSERTGAHATNARSGKSGILYNSIRKHGIDAFAITVLMECKTNEDAYANEQRLIEKMKPEYNLTDGGIGPIGRKVSEDQKRRQSDKMRGRPGPNRGKKVPAYVYEKVVATKKQRGPTEAELQNWKNNAARLMAVRNRTPVICVETQERFETRKEAVAAFGGRGSSQLNGPLQDSWRTYKGHHFIKAVT